MSLPFLHSVLHHARLLGLRRGASGLPGPAEVSLFLIASLSGCDVFGPNANAGPFAALTFPVDSLQLHAIGQTEDLEAAGADAHGNPTAVPGPVTWSPLDPHIVDTAQTSGIQVRAIDNGRARIEARVGAVADTLIVRVRQVARTIDVTPCCMTVNPGDTLRLTPTALDAHHRVVADASFEWSTTTPAVTVDDQGLVSGVMPGPAGVLATTDSATGSVVITVAQVFEAAVLAAGGAYACGLDAAGALHCWGYAPPGPSDEWREARPIPGAPVFETLTAGDGHQCGLLTNATTYCWGVHDRGQLGAGDVGELCRASLNFSYTCVWDPIAVAGNLTFDRVSAGGEHTCGLTDAGVPYCWGLNSSGQVGTTTTETCNIQTIFGPDPQSCTRTPLPVDGSLTFVGITAGGYHACGLTAAGAAWCWGANDSGQLGTGDNTDRAAPAQVTTALTFASLSTGHRHTCGLTASGAAYCWGAGGSGRLGNDDSVSTTTPVAVAGGRTWMQVSAGRAHTCGIEVGGIGYCWGRNAEGQLGNDMAGTNTATPTPVDGGARFTVIRASGGIRGYRGEQTGPEPPSYTCAIGEDAIVRCWGANAWGQLGDGGTANRPTPTPVRLVN